MPRILLISSEHEEGKVWQYSLQQRGYETQLIASPSEAITSVREAAYRLIIIDAFSLLAIMIPVVKQLRTYTTAPILLMILERDIPYVVSAFEAGADDTLIKPVGLRLFLTKVRIWIYRSGTGITESSAAQKIRDLQLNPVEQIFIVGDKPIKLTPLEYRVLNLLMHHRGQTLSKDLLVSRVWGYTDDADANLLKYVIYRLRRKIEPDPKHPRYILTVSGEGYVFDDTQQVLQSAVSGAILKSPYSKRRKIVSRIRFLVTIFAGATIVILGIRSQPEQHCVVSSAFAVMNEATGEIIQPAGQPTIRCFDTFAEAANYGSGGALNLPPNASEEEVARALRERTIP